MSRILNLGCGSKISRSSDVVNIDWSMYLRIKKNWFLHFIAKFVLDAERLKKLSSIPCNVVPYNLKNGIPFDDSSVDVVYHSHVFEHLDRSEAELFLLECKRVLKPGGILRIAVPDFSVLIQQYILTLDAYKQGFCEASDHENSVSHIIEQCVRKESYGSKFKSRYRRLVENILLGDARKRGETHQWMYDEITLTNVCAQAGYKNISVMDFNTSNIPNWCEYGLDQKEDGTVYKPNTLYLEAIK